MDIVISPEIAILLLIILLTGFIALYFLVGKNPSTFSDKILGIHFLQASISFIIYLANYIDSLPEDIYITYRLLAISLGTNILYFYTRSILIKPFAFRRESRWHLIPFALSLVLCIAYFINTTIASTDAFRSIVFIVNLLMTIIYTWLMIFQIITYEKARNQNFSNFDRKNLSWLKFIIAAFIIYKVFPMAWGILTLFTNIDPNFQIARIAAGSTTIIFCLTILWKVTTHSNNTDPIDDKKLLTKYQSSNLESDKKNLILEELMAHMKVQQPYLESNISLAEISAAINLPPRQVSQVINEELKQNFYEFINYHRIEYAKHLLSSTDKSELTISEIMYASGFNSKSSFHTAFKKSTKQTPSIFRDAYRTM